MLNRILKILVVILLSEIVLASLGLLIAYIMFMTSGGGSHFIMEPI